MVTVTFLTLIGNIYVLLSILAAVTVMGLGVDWTKHLLLYDRWPKISVRPAKTKHYGSWLLERIQYGLLLLYCLDLVAYKWGII